MELDTPDTLHTQLETSDTPTKQPGFFINRSFALLWSGQTISELGSHITGSGLPLVAVLMLNATALQVGLLTALSTLSALLLSLLAGVWVDRLPRRAIMIIADLGRALLLFTIPLAASLGILHIAQLYVVTFLVGTLTVFFAIANQSLLPMLVPREQLVAGNSKIEASSALAEIGGPTLAGLLIQTITAPTAIAFDALSFLFSAFCIGMMSSCKPHHTPQALLEVRKSVWREMYSGLRFMLAHPILRAVVAFASMRNFFGGAFATLYGLYIVRVLGLSPAIYGILIGLGGAGALLGSLGAVQLERRLGKGNVLIGGMLLSGCMALLTPLASGPLCILLAMLIVSQIVGDYGFVVHTINEISLRQTIVPEHMLGRINASMRFLVEGVGPLGAILAGVLSGLIGVRFTLLAGACGILCSTAWLFFSPLRRLR
jgi:MFS family permease